MRIFWTLERFPEEIAVNRLDGTGHNDSTAHSTVSTVEEKDKATMANPAVQVEQIKNLWNKETVFGVTMPWRKEKFLRDNWKDEEKELLNTRRLKKNLEKDFMKRKEGGKR